MARWVSPALASLEHSSLLLVQGTATLVLHAHYGYGENPVCSLTAPSPGTICISRSNLSTSYKPVNKTVEVAVLPPIAARELFTAFLGRVESADLLYWSSFHMRDAAGVPGCQVCAQNCAIALLLLLHWVEEHLHVTLLHQHFAILYVEIMTNEGESRPFMPTSVSDELGDLEMLCHRGIGLAFTHTLMKTDWRQRAWFVCDWPHRRCFNISSVRSHAWWPLFWPFRLRRVHVTPAHVSRTHFPPDKWHRLRLNP